MLKQVIAADSGDVIGEEKMEQAERNGLESERVQCTVSDTTMKATMMAVAMGSADSGLGISKEKLSKKSEKRFQAETSVMGGDAYATMVLSTNFIEGPRPHMLNKFQPCLLEMLERAF